MQGCVQHWSFALGHCVRRVIFPFEEFADKSHTDEFAVLHLTEIRGTRVCIHLLEDFVDARQRV